MADDLYRILEVDPAARPEVIAAAYRTLAKLLHPDTAGHDTTARMVALNNAYEVLRDPAERAAYDRARPFRRDGQRPPAPPPFSTPPSDVLMAFGKYRGLPIGSVPTSYLRWAYSNIEREDDLFDITSELIRRGAIDDDG